MIRSVKLEMRDGRKTDGIGSGDGEQSYGL
jgi:hypothetical protein